MELSEYQTKLNRISRVQPTFPGFPTTNVLIGLSSEAGEVQDIFKKAMERGIFVDREHLIEEMGDVLAYLTILASQQSISLEAIATKNIWKLTDKYGEPK